MLPKFAIQTANTILYCRSWAETIAFYRELIGLPILFESDWFVEFQLTPTARLSIADERRASIKRGGGAGITLAWQVADLEAARQVLQAQGIAVGPIKAHAWGARVCYFFDPEGHRLELWQAVGEETKP